MQKHQKPKLSTVIVVCTSIILLGLTFTLSYTSINSIKYLGKHSIELDAKSTKDNAMLFFMEITRRTAGAYSTYLKAIEDMLEITASQTKEVLLGNIKNTKKEKVQFKYEKYKDNDFYVLNNNNNFNCFYYGDESGFNKAETQVYEIISITPLLKTLYEKNSVYIKSIWLQTMDKIHLEYPRYYNYTQMDISSIKKYFENIFSEYPKEIEMHNSKAIWTKPYKDISGRMNIDVYKIIFSDDGKFLASMGVDLNFEKLLKTIMHNNLFSDENSDITDNIKSSYTEMNGFIFIVDKEGSIVAFPNEYSSLLSLPEIEYSKVKEYPEKLTVNLNESVNINIKDFAEEIKINETGVSNVVLKGENYIIAHKGISSTGWVLCFATQEKSLMTSVEETREAMNYTKDKMVKRFIIISLIFLILFIIATALFFRFYLLKPLSSLRARVKELGSGNLDISLKETGFAEISDLAENFNLMTKNLNNYILKLSDSIAKRKAIEANIEIAANLQLSSLPEQNPVFPDNNNIFLSARLIPSELTSGDFYDYFFVNENELFFTVGDISGKSLPAALFMTSTKLLIKKYALMGKKPNEIMSEVNNVLVLDNKKFMYSTVFCGSLNTKTGELIYCNCGHVNPIICKNNSVEFLQVKENFLVGLKPDFNYESESILLSKNDTFILYSDGITEAKNLAGNFYSEEKLLEKIQSLKNKKPDEIVDDIMNEIKIFSENCKPYDDYTILALKYT